jgi:hypothetical protein
MVALILVFCIIAGWYIAKPIRAIVRRFFNCE